MDQAEIERQLAGVVINGEKYNVFVVDAYEHLKSNVDLVRFLGDDDKAYQAYLALRDTNWATHTGQKQMFGWINCSAIIGLLREKGEHPQHMWWGEYEKNRPLFNISTVKQFDRLIAESGWSVTYREIPADHEAA